MTATTRTHARGTARLLAGVKDSTRAIGVIAPGTPVQRYGLIVLIGAISAWVEVKYGGFLTVSNILTTLNNTSSLCIAAVGASALVIAGRVDLSIGGQFGLLAMLAAIVGQDVGPGLAGTIAFTAVALGGGLILGFINAILVQYLKLAPIIVTIATGGIYTGVALAVTGGNPIAGIPTGIMSFGSSRVIGIPVPVVVAAGCVLLGSVLLLGTVTGLRVYAIGGNSFGTSLTGVPVDRIVRRLFCLQGLLVGVVALLETGEVGSASASFGTNFEIDVLTAVLLGGVLFAGGAGRPLPLLLGVLTIGVVDSALVFIGLAAWWGEIISGGVLLLALGSDQVAIYRRDRAVLRRTRGEDAEVDAERDQGSDDLLAAISGLAERDAGSQSTPRGAPVFEARGIELRYGAVRALRGVDLQAVPGEVLCLVGDNGAGKSSLVKVLSGVAQPTGGELVLDGDAVEFDSPLVARRRGIETVYQDLAVCTNLNIAHNVVLGAEPKRGRFGLRDDRVALSEAERRLSLIGTTVKDYRRPVQLLSGGQRQAIAIARVLHDDVRVALFDEPTAALGVAQTARVLSLIRHVAAQGVAVILITHDIEAVLGVADRIVVLRLGQVSFEGPAGSVTEAELAQFMAGLSLERVRAANGGHADRIESWGQAAH